MEDLFCKVARPTDSEDGQHGDIRIGIEGIWLVIIVVLQVDFALERHSSIWLNMLIITSTKIKVSSH